MRRWTWSLPHELRTPIGQVAGLADLLKSRAWERLTVEEREWLGRLGRAFAMLPPGRERDLWKENLRRDTELIESFAERLMAERPSHV